MSTQTTVQAGVQSTVQPTVEASAERLAQLSGAQRHDVAVVLGSGWRPAADLLGEVAWEAPWGDLGGFPAPTAEGHGGTVRSIVLGDGRRVLAFTGRVHAYEGHPLDTVTRSVRLAAAAGCRVVALTNAAGGLDPAWGVGQPVLISDHLNLTARSPLTGSSFVDLTDAYAPRLRELARQVDPSLPAGVYAAMPGPHYETPAEIRMLRTLGADLVGMSTVHETIVARSLGMQVLGMSLVTNPAAGTTDAALSHAEVLEAGAAAAERMGALLAQVLVLV